MYNVTKAKEKTLFNNKIQKLITLVRREKQGSKVDELVADID